MHNAGSGHCQGEGQELVLLLEDKPFRMVSQLGLLGGSTLLGVRLSPTILGLMELQSGLTVHL